MCLHTSQYGKLNRIDLFFHMIAFKFPSFLVFFFNFHSSPNSIPPSISVKFYGTYNILGAMQYSSFPLNGPFLEQYL